MSAKNLCIQDAEPKNGLVNEIWAKSAAHEQHFKPFSVRQLNKYPNTMLEFILSSMDDVLTNQSRHGKKKKVQ